MKLQAGDKLNDLQLSTIKTIASDNAARLIDLAEPLGAHRDQLKGNNGSFKMEVSLSIALVLRGIGEMSPNNPDSYITLTGLPPQDFFRSRAQVSIGNAHVNDPNASQQTRDDNALWDAVDDFTEQVALIFANGHPFELLTKNQVISMAATATAADIRNAYPREGDRRDGLGTTHHEAGALWMGDDVAKSVTNEFGRIHDTTNCYVAGPALFPTIGSPNPMLTGVALGRRTGEMLTQRVLRSARIAAETGFRSLFDGSRASISQWKMFGQGKFDLRDGVIVARPFGGLGLLAFPEGFNDFELRLQFFLDRVDDNSGVFVRFRNPFKPVPRRDGTGSDVYNDLPFVAVDTGFEIQIDELALGNRDKGEPDGLDKKRTGAIYDIPTTPGWIQQDFRGRNRQAKLNDWNDYSIQVRKTPGGDVYTVHLNGELTTTYANTDAYRGKAVADDPRVRLDWPAIPYGTSGLPQHPYQKVIFGLGAKGPRTSKKGHAVERET